jgi:Stress responsive A/B Barrel Domain
MKITSILVVLMAAVALLLSGFVPAHAASAKKKKKPKLRHVVSIKFKESATVEQIKNVEETFEALPKKINQIKKLEWGTNNSPEQRNKGFTHCFILTFKSEKDRDAYLADPAHKEFGSLVQPLIDDLFVIDFWTKD